MIPHKVPELISDQFPELIWRKDSDKLYLTFDDGPIPRVTEWVLDVLREKGVKATFFWVGDNVRKYPELAHKVVDDGHAFGNHTFNHVVGTKVFDDFYRNNILLFEKQIDKEGLSDKYKKLFRPPHGRIRKSQIESLVNEYRIVMWDVLVADYLKYLPAELCLKLAIRNTNPGSVIVFHDSLKSEKLLKYVLPRYIDHFKSLGFSFDIL
ncbi:polysaccharide deacetylase family protein [Aureibacter tunicatorum]|uniref:Peptidoglycan/xylan/chitin deacetylase (PgdA/CDA1 family) n=1 Tax=Aureibacter tunicatorum TaxID=866807 RepID=A0AAE3XSG2_9BACT|nr:polysaccharide deacetylase family protein [Aureibacter tunicatorum]MDR6241268.1 peptidoglycan/xylan/chitin deacetylase (PgdA/CDA1 family) [Aureibacter tunicatorum]BDD03528.1 polysaccharide deacetylase [Aureibacter tunicatorum]